MKRGAGQEEAIENKERERDRYIIYTHNITHTDLQCVQCKELQRYMIVYSGTKNKNNYSIQ